ncbi:hypothetical protein GGR50DRAFT_698531 [Xylaria sp. CBS 124048]|nr:hypothetical protein GGR50DRAFT_698531 [Xylaria sp. CBS 124048]
MSTTELSQPSNALVLYNPQDWDVVMGDAPEIAHGRTVQNPPDWLREANEQMWHSYQAVVTYSQQLSEENRRDVESLRDQYTRMRDDYAALVHLQQSSVGATENMLSQFHRQIEKASNKFASNIYGAIAQFASDNKARDEAFQQISAITQRQQQRIEALEHNAGEEQEFRQNVTHWAETKESQINDLLARD